MTFLNQNCPSYIKYDALHGDYAALQDDILSRCKGFTFFFIDPKGL